MHHDDGAIGGQATIGKHARNKPAAQSHMIVAAAKGHIAVIQAKIGRSTRHGLRCCIGNARRNKANDAGMQKLVVVMKDELEKIKEQSNNVL